MRFTARAEDTRRWTCTRARRRRPGGRVARAGSARPCAPCIERRPRRSPRCGRSSTTIARSPGRISARRACRGRRRRSRTGAARTGPICSWTLDAWTRRAYARPASRALGDPPAPRGAAARPARPALVGVRAAPLQPPARPAPAQDLPGHRSRGPSRAPAQRATAAPSALAGAERGGRTRRRPPRRPAARACPAWLAADFSCIHRYEGAWTSNTGNGYYGGLQMDLEFQRLYGRRLPRAVRHGRHLARLGAAPGGGPGLRLRPRLRPVAEHGRGPAA